MAWPPKSGELLPRASEPLGVRRKLVEYSLDASHRLGGPKAHGFSAILGITIEHVDYVEDEICSGILNSPITAVRDNRPHGHSCAVEFHFVGLAPMARVSSGPNYLGSEGRGVASSLGQRISEAVRS